MQNLALSNRVLLDRFQIHLVNKNHHLQCVEHS